MVVTGSHNVLLVGKSYRQTYGGDGKPQCLIGWQVLQTTYGGDRKPQCLIGWQVLQTTYGGDGKPQLPYWLASPTDNIWW